MLRTLLGDYPYVADRAFLIKGFSKGFSLGYTGQRVRRDSDCLQSAILQPDVVKQKLAKEIQAGRVARPFDSPPIENLQCSPTGLVPKK